jgi:DNA-binding response OmpR family regulator
LRIEDEAPLLRQLAEALADAGYAVDCATDGEPVKLTSHEFRVLSYLMHHSGRVVSQGDFIETVRGLGYRIGARR